MSEKSIICPLCRHQFIPSDHPGCAQCPLHKKCVMICCPACGYTIPMKEESTIVKWTSNLLSSMRSKESQD